MKGALGQYFKKHLSTFPEEVWTVFFIEDRLRAFCEYQAVYETVQSTVLVSPPATNEEVTPASSRVVDIPAKFETVTRKVKLMKKDKNGILFFARQM